MAGTRGILDRFMNAVSNVLEAPSKMVLINNIKALNESDNINEIKSKIAEHVDWLTQYKDGDGNNILHHAVMAGRLDLVEFIIDIGKKEGVDIGMDDKNNGGHRPIDIARENLGSSGEDAKIHTALNSAMKEKLDFMSENKASYTGAQEVKNFLDDKVSLISLIKANKEKQVEKFLAQNQNPDILNQVDNATNKNTPLHWAVLLGNDAIVKKILERNPEQSKNGAGLTPLQLAENAEDSKSSVSIVRSLQVYSDDRNTLLLKNGREGNWVGVVKELKSILENKDDNSQLPLFTKDELALIKNNLGNIEMQIKKEDIQVQNVLRTSLQDNLRKRYPFFSYSVELLKSGTQNEIPSDNKYTPPKQF